MRLRNVFAASRFIIGLAVLGSFVGSAILLVIATITLFRIAWNEIVNFDPDSLGGRPSHIDRLAVQLIEITDVILLGTVLYIVALGLYQLFIDQSLVLPRWLKVNDLTDLKRDLIGVVVVLLGVSFLGEVVNWEGENDVLALGAGIALVIAALGFILWLTPNTHDPDEAP
jgi:uncharacterized membrane protein YqhA